MKPILPIFICCLAVVPVSAHQHFAAGISDTNGNGEADAGEPLAFVGTDPSTKTFRLLARPVGQRCGGHYMLDELPRTLFPVDAFSIIALSDGQYEVAAPYHAHTGAWIWAEIVSVSGPAGGTFGFWEENSQVVTHALVANEETGNPDFVIGEGFDDAGEDPAGHIHGRAWTADKPGEYLVGIRLIDRSTTAPGGGPWHVPSQTYLFRFVTGPAFQPTIVRSETSATLTWSSQMGIWEPYQTGITFRIERMATAPGSVWTTIGSVTGTSADTVDFIDDDPPGGGAIYRLAYDWAAP